MECGLTGDFQTERAKINPKPNKITVRAHSKVYNKFQIWLHVQNFQMR